MHLCPESDTTKRYWDTVNHGLKLLDILCKDKQMNHPTSPFSEKQVWLLVLLGLMAKCCLLAKTPGVDISLNRNKPHPLPLCLKKRELKWSLIWQLPRIFNISLNSSEIVTYVETEVLSESLLFSRTTQEQWAYCFHSMREPTDPL